MMDAFENYLLQSAANLIWDHIQPRVDELIFDDDEEDATYYVWQQLHEPYFQDWLESLEELTLAQLGWIRRRTWDILNGGNRPELADEYAIWYFRNWQLALPDYYLVLYFLEVSQDTIHNILRGKRLLRNLVEEMEVMSM